MDAKEDTFGQTALMFASASNHIELVKLLLQEWGADVNATNYDGETALYWASINGNTVIVAMLLENGANVNAQDHVGETALSWANGMVNTEIMDILKKAIEEKDTKLLKAVRDKKF